MVMHYYGSNINQYSIIDVLRTSDQIGTRSVDLVRGGHFSKLSATPPQYKIQYPHVAPKQGWNKYKEYGYASFGYGNNTCYVNDVIHVLDQNIPVIVLMKFSRADEGGHYRVVVGYEYDGTNYTMVMLDPWDRENNPRIVTYDMDTFCYLWNYSEPIKSIKQASYGTFFSVMISPWKVNLEYEFDLNYKVSEMNGSNIIVTADITYPCVKPFCNKDPVALASQALITYPKHVSLTQGDSSIVYLGDIAPGQNRRVKWHFYVQDQDLVDIPLSLINIKVTGEVHVVVPETWYNETMSNPSYKYVDLIGGKASLNL
jgi:hypothetical protein